MAKQALDYKKMGLTFLGFGAAKLIYDFLAKGAIDFYGVVGIPLIAIGLIYLVDKDRFLSKD